MKAIAISLLLMFPFSFIAQDCPILPHPLVYKTIPGEIQMLESLSLDFNSLPPNLIEQFKSTIALYHDVPLIDVKSKPLLIFKQAINVPLDSYSINVNEQIIITYSSSKACYYAFHSLMQLLKQNNEGYFIQKCFINDFPKFQWRGLHLDVSRHFFTVDEVKKYIDLMSLYKLNMFHWHLTDDQGWRIEIKKYPKLTEIGAWRDSTVNEHYTTTPRTYTKQRYGGFYTQDEIKEVVAYAAEKYITIVPEIEMPGHSRAALAAYPQYSCTGEQQNVPGLWGVFDDIFCAKEESILFLQDVLSEVIPLFPGTYIHVGGDEAPKTRWNKCEKCQSVIKEQKLKDEHELQSYFIQRMDAYLMKQGKKLIGWDEILE